MRTLIACLAILTAVPAVAQPATPTIGPVWDLTVAFSPDLDKRRDVIGTREREILARMLRETMIDELGDLATPETGGRLILVIQDAKPNRPTLTELGRRPGLSITDSFGIGGAKIHAVYVGRDGQRVETSYSWYGDDISLARGYSEWHDAERAFRQFADRLGG